MRNDSDAKTYGTNNINNTITHSHATYDDGDDANDVNVDQH